MNAKKLLKGSLMALMLPTMLLSCSDNNEPNESEKSAEKQAIIAQCVNNVVVPPTNRLPTLQWIWRVCALI